MMRSLQARALGHFTVAVLDLDRLGYLHTTGDAASTPAGNSRSDL